MSDEQDYVMAYWVKQLCQVQLPVLSGTIKELNAVTRSDDSCAAQLSEIILKDSALTARVLRVANSVYHNPNSTNSINTITRAVVQLGFRGVKAIVLSVMLVESLLRQDARDRMVEWMARGFHTAVQARNLIRCAGDEHTQEEVFITSLLLHLGELAFWAYNNDIVEKLDRQLEPHSTGNSELEREILGATMKDIGRVLVEAWGLGDFLDEALEPGEHPHPATQAVLLGEKICFAIEQGWESQSFCEVLVEVSMFTGKSKEEARKLIEQGTESAAGIAVVYGANKVCHFIPSTLEKKKTPERIILSADFKLQLDVLRDMRMMVDQGVDANTLFQTVVEGIHRGIGLERVALCLLDVRNQSLMAKYILGEDTEEWRDDMSFPVRDQRDNLFAHCLQSRKGLWLQPDHSDGLEPLLNKKVQRLLTVNNLLMAPLYAGNRPVGVVVADRGRKLTLITEDQQESFDHFAQQTGTSLSLLADKKKPSSGKL